MRGRIGDLFDAPARQAYTGMSQTLAQAVGVRKAKELSYTARVFKGDEALRLGLANDSVAGQDELDSEYTDILNTAERLAEFRWRSANQCRPPVELAVGCSWAINQDFITVDRQFKPHPVFGDQDVVRRAAQEDIFQR